ncbi:hypothetical protein [Amycolatopsis alba]|uniref:Uncharacterized protein n=1 Tax=Amycolatopsis alba DSM 44262 TaxID=1125972 RepID=A0A229S1A0_AMYAL|nr:hypothetical protein [Amycolatopsis alba]OXM52585.1 hypothetical protein CFP75_10490 [Amycolatopsis alba DSM 44262]
MIIQDTMPATVLAVGRLMAGTAGESRRSAHLFDLHSGGSQPEFLHARCGAAMPYDHLEWIPVGSGMPCERCLGLAGSADQTRLPRPSRGA